ncbi:MAG: exodeoxyribonuclease VII large subunit, partial [Phycisphaeraceae bacterium]
RRPRELPDRARRQIDQLEKQLARTLPQRLRLERERLAHVAPRLTAAGPRRAQEARRRLDALARHLEAVSPNRVLERGFTYTLDERGRLVRHAVDTTAGQALTTVFADGRVRSRVEGGNAQPRRKPTRKRADPGQQETLF